MESAKNIEELIAKKNALHNDNEHLKKKIFEIKEYTKECDGLERIYGKSRPRGSFFGRMRHLPNFDEYWSKTVFWQYHQEIDRYRFIPLDLLDTELENNHQDRDAILRSFFSCNIVAYCEMAMPTNKGTLLYLSDPFGQKVTFISSGEVKDATRYVGRLLHIAGMRSQRTNNFQILKIEKLPFTLYEKLY